MSVYWIIKQKVLTTKLWEGQAKYYSKEGMSVLGHFYIASVP